MPKRNAKGQFVSTKRKSSGPKKAATKKRKAPAKKRKPTHNSQYKVTQYRGKGRGGGKAKSNKAQREAYHAQRAAGVYGPAPQHYGQGKRYGKAGAYVPDAVDIPDAPAGMKRHEPMAW